ncbi:MAG TPA: efflux transporter outer membrane subunit [Methylocystis sp.]|nr:efflux transporter outer membrane subunit [Methylocystis sp.]
MLPGLRGAPCAVLAATFALAGCLVGPDYVPPPVQTPEKFKELKGTALKGWKLAAPRDRVDASPWWQVYNDHTLDELEAQVEISNQTVAAALEAYEQARTLIREAQAALFPTITASYTTTRQYTGAALLNTGSSSSSSSSSTTPSAISTSVGSNVLHGQVTAIYTPQGSLTWEIDLWGKLRRQIESNVAGAQVSEADLENAKLTAQAALATAYFNLRAAYSLKDLLEQTAREYKRTLDITRNQYKAGTAAEADVVTAETQLLSTQAQAINTGVAIAQMEHAIAVLIGKPPADFSLPPMRLTGYIPSFPVEVPTTLLERRPDIAAAERMMQQENALIGVALAAYYPDVTLSADLGYTGHVPLPINPAHEFWSLTAMAAETVFEGGLRSAQVDAATSTYRQSVASYRETVLTAFQQVEDQLAAIRVQARQLQVQEKAVAEARKSVTFYLNQYRAGVVAFTSVVVAEAALLSAEQSALTTRQNLFLASVALIEALGGGWDRSHLPPPEAASTGISLFPQR